MAKPPNNFQLILPIYDQKIKMCLPGYKNTGTPRRAGIWVLQ